MISSPATPFAQLYQQAQQFAVLLGPTDGSAPTTANQVNWLIPQRLSLTAGAARDDVLVFKVDLATLGQRLVDTTTPTGIQRQIEIRSIDDQGNPTTVLGWGFLSANPQAIDGEEESTIFEARIAKQHFGKPLTSYSVTNPATLAIITVNRPLIFNPQIDEIIEPNMSSILGGNSQAYPVDPESLRTTASQTYQQQTAAPWKLSDAVLFLCWQLNPDQTWIKNPGLDDCTNAFKTRDTLLKNVEIRTGAYLPEALDELLTPFEYGWYLVHSLNNNGLRQTTIRFYARGEGVKKQVLLQRPGQVRDIKKTNVTAFDASYNINDLANRIEVYGDYLKREATFLLQKGWANTLDSTDIEDLDKSHPTYEAHVTVGRKWVLNEAGDYIGLRPEITTPYSLDSLFGQIQSVRRRRFIPCLSQHVDADDPESNRFKLDWYDDSVTGATDHTNPTDPGWTRLVKPFAVLHKECGIMFEGTLPPNELWDNIDGGHPEKALLRITCTVVGDQRISGIATRQSRSPNGQDVTLVLDLHDRFQMSKVDASSIFTMAPLAPRPSSAKDDTTLIQTYANEVRDIEDAMKVHCSITLEGVNHPEYSIGDLIDNVKGRNLSLNGYNPSGGANARNPQVVGFVWHLAGTQKLELLMDSFERERPEIVTDQHQRTLA